LGIRGTLKPINVVENSSDTNKIGKRLPSTADILLLTKGIAATYDDKSNTGETKTEK
jgi:hypothetical protein